MFCFAMLCLLLVTWWVYFTFGEEIISKLYYGGANVLVDVPSELAETKNVNEFLGLTKLFLLLLSFLSIAFVVTWMFRDALKIYMKNIFRVTSNGELQSRIFDACMLLGCSWACFYSLINQGFQGSWYVIEDMMNFRGWSPFQQRILFILLAKMIRWAFPGLTYIQSYCLSQLVPIVLGFYFIKKWAELFVSKAFSFIAQLILLAMLIPTITYYTFYDFGIVLFFTICLYLLFKREIATYYFVFAIGILNHEIILFMVFLYVAIFLKGNILWNKVWISVLMQVSIFIVIRIMQFIIIPAPNFIAPGRIWVNLNYIFNKPLMLSTTIVSLAVWYLISFMGIKHAPKDLQRCLILIPLLIVMTFFVGQLNELRQFDAFIPIAIAIIMCLFGSIQKGLFIRVNNHQKDDEKPAFSM